MLSTNVQEHTSFSESLTMPNQLSPQSFAFWLQGFFELSRAGLKEGESLVLTPAQIEMIEDHLQLVFTHVITVPGQSDGGAGGAHSPPYVPFQYAPSFIDTIKGPTSGIAALDPQAFQDALAKSIMIC